ncbi:MAG: isochorismate synthase MenF [Actinomycetes bacterium]
MSDLTVRTWAIDDPGPLLDRLPPTDGVAWLQGEDGMVGIGAAARIDPGVGPGRTSVATDALARLAAGASVRDDVRVAGTGLVAFGSFTFDVDTHGSSLVVPEVVVGRRGRTAWLTCIGPADDERLSASEPPLPPAVATATAHAADRPRYAGSSVPDVRWLEAVATAVQRIRAGELEKVVLARDHAVWSKETFDARVLARRLAERFPGCSTFVVDGLVGATPELLVGRTGARVESLPLAGTTGRDADPDLDAALGRALLDSAKDRWEHELLVRNVAEVLGRVCRDLHHADTPFLLQLDNVQHLATRFVGELAPADDGSLPSALELAGALHPTPAVAGTPTADALAVLRELEGMDRGRYAAPVGWVDAAGDGEWGIALRCAELSGARARLFAGAGIVADSLPEDELEETRIKLLAAQSAFRG